MKCEFCGRELETRKVFGGIRIPVPCTCEGATRHYEEEDRRQRDDEFDRVMRQSVATSRIPPKFRLYPEYGSDWSLYFYGEQGRGKTERACGVLRRWLREGIEETAHNQFVQTRSARFVSVPEGLMEMRRTYDVPRRPLRYFSYTAAEKKRRLFECWKRSGLVVRTEEGWAVRT